METAVVDASVIVNLLADRGWGGGAERVLGGTRLSAPAHLDAEVLQAIASLERGGLSSEQQAAAAVQSVRDLPVSRVPLPVLTEVAWSLRHNLSLYDAFYVGLAQVLDCQLITADRRIAAAPGVGIPIKLIAG